MNYALTGLEDKVAVVTGAGRMRSIGRQIAVELARAGCDVVLTGTGRAPERRPEDEQAAGWNDIESVAEEIRSLGRRAVPVVADVSDPAQVDALLATTLAEFGRVDVVVNNAAASRGGDRGPLLELDVEDFDRVVRINLRGTFLMLKAFATAMLDNEPDSHGQRGTVVNISSIGGKQSGPGTGVYSASKAGVQSLTSTAAKELGKDGIRVNALCPGVTATSRLDDLSAEQWQAYVGANVPLGRVGDPLEVAHAAVFLASDQAAWVTGQCWNVDGGQLTIR
ncbi:3-oxoacyl-ACP reductase family protein [Nocardioides sp. AE5]|uniref:SDR family NAD(P)-dependent oxidoreductase n=1 Tax=Nocardioides sp. AE5 TaxID=2962573 RepID=UPI002882745D|nr:3-oxoacyl-ACP reductase family protein [Nocardioides sp. AE5]MDT0203212.1 3-oxoacyl-ACP reductase family protein [Nocardioides sp. AE5]